MHSALGIAEVFKVNSHREWRHTEDNSTKYIRKALLDGILFNSTGCRIEFFGVESLLYRLMDL